MYAEKRPMRKESLCSVWTISNAGLAKMRQTLSTSMAIQGSVIQTREEKVWATLHQNQCPFTKRTTKVNLSHL